LSSNIVNPPIPDILVAQMKTTDLGEQDF